MYRHLQSSGVLGGERMRPLGCTGVLGGERMRPLGCTGVLGRPLSEVERPLDVEVSAK